MRIGIIGAMNEEIIQLKNIMTIESEENIAGFTYYIGKIENKKIVLVESGIGKVNSAVCTSLLLQKYNIEKVIFTGVAGAIGKELNIGDIVISSELIEHDFDCTAFGLEPGIIPRMENSIFKADKRLIDLASASSSDIIGIDKVKIGKVVSGDQFIASKDKIDWLRETFNAQCTEMEGASVAHVCYLFKTPFVIIRAISDKADGSAQMDFNEFVILAAENSKNVLMEMLKRW
ncbi:MAG: 5'-methylthioadenosine/adenosylhomocysteine nucleosidase [Fusobacteriaceae bacterium]